MSVTKKPSLTQDNLSDSVVSSIKISKEQSMKLVKNFFKILEDELKNGNDAKLLRFGSFKKRKSSQRIAMNFKTNERIVVEGKDQVKFIPSNSFKAKIKKFYQQTDE